MPLVFRVNGTLKGELYYSLLRVLRRIVVSVVSWGYGNEHQKSTKSTKYRFHSCALLLSADGSVWKQLTA